MNTHSRRRFLRLLGPTSLALPFGIARSIRAAPADLISRESTVAAPSPLRLDFHVHLFGIGDGGTGCRFSEVQRKHVNYFYLTKLLGLAQNGRIDQDYVATLAQTVRASSIQQVLLQAWDCRYDEAGQPD